jgi:hypothetical protein
VWAIHQILPPPWAVVLGQILLGLMVLGHGRVYHGHGLIHISHKHLLTLVFLRFPPFARVHRIPEIGAIFLNPFGGLLVGIVSSRCGELSVKVSCF